MPIRRHHRWLYPIDWRELSALIRFRLAKGRCETCGRPLSPMAVGPHLSVDEHLFAHQHVERVDARRLR